MPVVSYHRKPPKPTPQPVEEPTPATGFAFSGVTFVPPSGVELVKIERPAEENHEGGEHDQSA
jgi:hypothetical protein